MHHLRAVWGSTCEVSVVGGVDEVVRERLGHVVQDVQLLWGHDGVFLPSQILAEAR